MTVIGTLQADRAIFEKQSANTGLRGVPSRFLEMKASARMPSALHPARQFYARSNVKLRVDMLL